MEYKNISSYCKTDVTFNKCTFLEDVGDIKKGNTFDEVTLSFYGQVSVLEKVTGDYKEDKKNTMFYTIEVVSDDKEKRAALDVKDLFFTFKSYTTHGDDKGLSFLKVKIVRDCGPFEKGQKFQSIDIRIDLMKVRCFNKEATNSHDSVQIYNIELKKI